MSTLSTCKYLNSFLAEFLIQYLKDFRTFNSLFQRNILIKIQAMYTLRRKHNSILCNLLNSHTVIKDNKGSLNVTSDYFKYLF